MPPRYTEEFKIEAVKQVTEHNYPVEETAIRLGVHPDSLRTWINAIKHHILSMNMPMHKVIMQRFVALEQNSNVLQKSEIF